MLVSILNLLFIAALFIGLVFLLDANPFADEKKISISFNRTSAETKRQQINADRELTGKEKIISKISGLLDLIDKPWTFYYRIAGACFAAGTIFGLIVFSDIFLALPMGLISTPLSFIILRSLASGKIRKQLEVLENAMSIITNSYITTENIITSAEKYVKIKNKGVQDEFIKITPFDRFISNTRMINPNVKRALKIMAAEVDNKDFTAWTNVLIQCQDDKGLKYMLKPIVQGMNDVKSLQLKSDTQMAASWRQFIMMVVATFSTIPFLRIMNKEWFDILTKTGIGKALVILMILSALGSSIYAAKINKPIRDMK
ncbi:MAG TPA: hypothetical protein VN381_03570 [Anaerovoracaceae bacterium]|nr:hypothetical protein [Anaerovoracaceae bacterium]